MKTLKQILNEAKNPKFTAKWSTAPEHLEKLSKDKNWRVRESVAQNSATPHHILHALSKDKIWAVISSVARNPLTHPDILHKLSKDKDEDVRNSALENLKDR